MPATQILTAIHSLTDAQTKALPTTGIEIVPAPGAGTFIFPFYGILHATWVADYTNIDAQAQLIFKIGSTVPLIEVRQGTNTGVGGLLAGGGPDGVMAWCPSSFRGVSPGVGNVTNAAFSGTYDSDIVNLPLKLVGDNAAAGDFTGGNAGNLLTATVLYTIIDV